jgi:hypothetical protein
MNPQTQAAKLAAYEAVDKYTRILAMERATKERLAMQLTAERAELMRRVADIDSQLQPLLDRLALLEHEANRFSAIV